MADMLGEKLRVTPTSLAPQKSELSPEQQATLKRVTQQSSNEYLRHYSKQPPMLHHEMSRERAIQFHYFATGGKGYNEHMQQLASGFAKIAKLDDARGWRPYKSGFPHQVEINPAVQDLVLDIACMRVSFDEWSIGDRQVDQAIRSELQTVLAELGFTPPESESELQESPFKPPLSTVDDVFSHIFTHPVRLTPLPASETGE